MLHDAALHQPADEARQGPVPEDAALHARPAARQLLRGPGDGVAVARAAPAQSAAGHRAVREEDHRGPDQGESLHSRPAAVRVLRVHRARLRASRRAPGHVAGDEARRLADHALGVAEVQERHAGGHAADDAAVPAAVRRRQVLTGVRRQQRPHPREGRRVHAAGGQVGHQRLPRGEERHGDGADGRLPRPDERHVRGAARPADRGDRQAQHDPAHAGHPEQQQVRRVRPAERARPARPHVRQLLCRAGGQNRQHHLDTDGPRPGRQLLDSDHEQHAVDAVIRHQQLRRRPGQGAAAAHRQPAAAVHEHERRRGRHHQRGERADERRPPLARRHAQDGRARRRLRAPVRAAAERLPRPLREGEHLLLPLRRAHAERAQDPAHRLDVLLHRRRLPGR